MRFNARDISVIGRNTQGVKIITLKSDDDAVIGVAKLVSGKEGRRDLNGRLSTCHLFYLTFSVLCVRYIMCAKF